MMKLPNFFLIGAPKCGTTALSQYLSTHPDVFFSSPKEPHFFNTDFGNRHTVQWNDYVQYFRAAQAGHVAIGEGSVFYLNSQVAVPNILRVAPDARFIVMLRNPVDMAYSWHSEALYSFGETERDFERAWRLQGERRAGRQIPPKCQEVKTLMYGDLCMLGTQVERLLARHARDCIHFILFDDFIRDPQREYIGALHFLGLEDDGRVEFPRVNSNKTFRSGTLETYAEATFSFLKHVKAKSGITKNFGFASAVRKLNTIKKQRPPMSDELQAELIEYFFNDVQRLQRLIGRDLSSWLTP